MKAFVSVANNIVRFKTIVRSTVFCIAQEGNELESCGFHHCVDK
jgi:hypothetical protein